MNIMIMMASFMLVYWFVFSLCWLISNNNNDDDDKWYYEHEGSKYLLTRKKTYKLGTYTMAEATLSAYTQISIPPSLLPFNKKLEKKSKLQIHYWSQRYYHPNVKNKMQPSVIWTTTKSSIQYFQISSMHKHY